MLHVYVKLTRIEEKLKVQTFRQQIKQLNFDKVYTVFTKKVDVVVVVYYLTAGQ